MRPNWRDIQKGYRIMIIIILLAMFGALVWTVFS